MEEIFIHSEVINLDQLLKWAGLIESGAEAKILIEDGIVFVNNKIITERRKKIYPGDILELKGLGMWKVIRS